MESKRTKPSNFGNRLDKLLKGDNCYNREFTYDELSKKTKCGTRQSISNWIVSANFKPILPNGRVIQTISEFFGVTTDYLLGYDDIPTKVEQEEFDVFEKFGFSVDFYNSLTSLRNEKPYMYELIVKMLDTIFTVNNDNEQVGLLALHSIAKFIDRPKKTHYKVIHDFQIDAILKMVNSCKTLTEIQDLQDYLYTYLHNLSNINTDYEDAISLSKIQTNLIKLRETLDGNIENTEIDNQDEIINQKIQEAESRIYERHKEEIDALKKEFEDAINEDK